MIHYSYPGDGAPIQKQRDTDFETATRQLRSPGRKFRLAGLSHTREKKCQGGCQPREGHNGFGDSGEGPGPADCPSLYFEMSKLGPFLQKKHQRLSAASPPDTLILTSEFYSGSFFCPGHFSPPEAHPDSGSKSTFSLH